MADTSTATVLLVHGWAGSFDRTWKRSGLVDLLADAGRRVLPYDLPGHGSATKSHDPNEYRDLAGDVLARVGAQPVDAVGFSLGAITLLRALIRSPQSFNKVVLAGIGDGVFFCTTPRDQSASCRGWKVEPSRATLRRASSARSATSRTMTRSHWQQFFVDHAKIR